VHKVDAVVGSLADPEGVRRGVEHDRRVTCSIEEMPAAALMAIRCRTLSVPTDPIAMNTVRIPSSAPWRPSSSTCTERETSETARHLI